MTQSLTGTQYSLSLSLTVMVACAWPIPTPPWVAGMERDTENDSSSSAMTSSVRSTVVVSEVCRAEKVMTLSLTAVKSPGATRTQCLAAHYNCCIVVDTTVEPPIKDSAR